MTSLTLSRVLLISHNMCFVQEQSPGTVLYKCVNLAKSTAKQLCQNLAPARMISQKFSEILFVVDFFFENIIEIDNSSSKYMQLTQ